jgi:hypothetical protein
VAEAARSAEVAPVLVLHHQPEVSALRARPRCLGERAHLRIRARHLDEKTCSCGSNRRLGGRRERTVRPVWHKATAHRLQFESERRTSASAEGDVDVRTGEVHEQYNLVPATVPRSVGGECDLLVLID